MMLEPWGSTSTMGRELLETTCPTMQEHSETTSPTMQVLGATVLRHGVVSTTATSMMRPPSGCLNLTITAFSLLSSSLRSITTALLSSTIRTGWDHRLVLASYRLSQRHAPLLGQA